MHGASVSTVSSLKRANEKQEPLAIQLHDQEWPAPGTDQLTAQLQAMPLGWLRCSCIFMLYDQKS